LQPNGFRILSLIPGLVPTITGRPIEVLTGFSTLDEDRGLLDVSDIPSRMHSLFGAGMLGVFRAKFQQTVVEPEAAEARGIPIHWGHKLTSLEQHDESVHVVFENGANDAGSFVVGCDGLHSNTRVALFGRERPEFTGLTRVSMCHI